MNTERLIPTSLSNPQITQIYTDGKPPGSNPCESVQSVVKKPDQAMSPVDAALEWAHSMFLETQPEKSVIDILAIKKHSNTSISGEAFNILADEVRRLREYNNELANFNDRIMVSIYGFRERNAKLREQTRWRPIESAPEREPIICYITTGYIAICVKREGVIIEHLSRIEIPASYWMPLPAAPESGEKGGAA